MVSKLAERLTTGTAFTALTMVEENHSATMAPTPYAATEVCSQQRHQVTVLTTKATLQLRGVKPEVKAVTQTVKHQKTSHIKQVHAQKMRWANATFGGKRREESYCFQTLQRTLSSTRSHCRSTANQSTTAHR